MTITNPMRGHGRRLYLPTYREATFGGGSTTLDIVMQARRNEGSALIESVLTETDMGVANGYGNATQQIHMGTELAEKSLPWLASAEALGVVWGFWGGSPSKSGTGNIVHTHGINNGQFRSMEIEEHVNGATVSSGIDRRQKGVYVLEWTVSGGRTGIVTFDWNVRGIGSKTTASNQTESSMLIPGEASGFFMGQSTFVGVRAMTGEHNPADFSYTAPSAANTPANTSGYTSFGCVLDTWTVTGRTVIIEDTTRCVGSGSSSGLFGSEPSISHREVTASINLKANDGTGAGVDQYLDVLTGGSTGDNVELSLLVEMVNDYDVNTSDFAGACIQVPVMMIDQNPDLQFGEMDTFTLNMTAKQSVGPDPNAGSGQYPIVQLFTHDAYDYAYGTSAP